PPYIFDKRIILNSLPEKEKNLLLKLRGAELEKIDFAKELTNRKRKILNGVRTVTSNENEQMKTIRTTSLKRGKAEQEAREKREQEERDRQEREIE
ncbi:26026_t:CDS:1, partial [Racocetra persica]